MRGYRSAQPKSITHRPLSVSFGQVVVDQRVGKCLVVDRGVHPRGRGDQMPLLVVEVWAQ
jgi:hypothetical protein